MTQQPPPNAWSLATPGNTLEAERIGSWELDLKRQRSRVDETFCELSGLPPDLRELDFSSWLECVHPRDRRKVRRAVEAVVREGREYACEFRVVLPDGTVRWLAGHGCLVRYSDASRRIISINVDITDRKLAERPSSPHLDESVAQQDPGDTRSLFETLGGRETLPELERLEARVRSESRETIGRTAPRERHQRCATALRRPFASPADAADGKRRRLARDLPDRLKQLIAAAKVRLDLMSHCVALLAPDSGRFRSRSDRA